MPPRIPEATTTNPSCSFYWARPKFEASRQITARFHLEKLRFLRTTRGAIRLARLGVFVLLAGALPALADGLSGLTPAEEYRGSIAKVRSVLAPHRTEIDMAGFVGALPKRCVSVPPEAKSCIWPLSKEEKGWWPLADALYTGDRLNLVCEFPANDGPRLEDSCSVHSQRSNRRYFRGQLHASSAGGHMRKSLTKAKRAELAKRTELTKRAQQNLARARTAFALSTLVGDAPVECRSGGQRVFCSWKTTADTYGHGTLAMSIGADMSKKVRMSCMLPADGSPRAPDSCTVQIGD